MTKKIKIFHMETCPYCKKLMEGLDKLEIIYEKIDVDSKEGEKKFLKVYEVSKNENMPTILVNNKILIPEITFNTIEEALNLIKDLDSTTS